MISMEQEECQKSAKKLPGKIYRKRIENGEGN
jgi:hypothetical protein